MEFFIENILPIGLFVSYSWLGYALGCHFTKKKLQGKHVTPKVGTNKHTKEYCPFCGSENLYNVNGYDHQCKDCNAYWAI